MEKPIMMGVKEFANESGLSEKCVRKFCHMAGFPVMASGVRLLIHYEKAKEWLAGYAVKFDVDAAAAAA